MDWDTLLRNAQFRLHYEQLWKKPHQVKALADLYFGAPLLLNTNVYKALVGRGLVDYRSRWSTADTLTEDGFAFVAWVYSGAPTMQDDDPDAPTQERLF